MIDKLAIGPFKDMSGYATLAKNYLRALFLVTSQEEWALASTKYDSGSKTPLIPEIAAGHKRQISGDIKTIVQIVTPNEMRAVQGARNIAICCWETDRIPPHWAIQLNAFDAIVVPCQANKEAFQKSGVSKPIHVVWVPAFEEDYQLDTVEPFKIPGIDGETTIYYNIAQWSHKKGIDAAIRSYFLAFQRNENVLLVLKGYIGMLNQNGDAHKVLGAINEIKAAMRLPQYPRVYLTDVTMTENELKKIHKMGDCYVNFSRGEGWCIPAFDALLYGKELITTTHTAMAEWANPINVWPVDSVKDSVHNMPHPDPGLYTAKENWYEPIILSGAEAFKAHFKGMKRNGSPEDRTFVLNMAKPTLIGQALKEIING